MRLTSRWKMALSEPANIARIAGTSNTQCRGKSPKAYLAPKIVKVKRSSTYSDTFVAVAAMKAETPEGAKA